MKKKPRLLKYAELFKRNIAPYLADHVSVKTTIYPVSAPGAIFEFVFNQENDRSETIAGVKPTIGAVLSSIPQNIVSGGAEGITFGGTNIFMTGNRLLLIKGEDAAFHWDGNMVKEDVQRVVSTSQGGKHAS